ncbi:MAG: YfjI family protein [Pseudomonadota bacterium]
MDKHLTTSMENSPIVLDDYRSLGSKSIHTSAQRHDWPDPTPIHAIKHTLAPVVALPAQLIPAPYRDWLVDISERMQCPLDYVVAGALVVTASVIGAGCAIRPKQKDSWTVIPNLWGGIVGPPSSLKSPALKEILKPLEELESEAYEVYEKQQREYAVQLAAFKAAQEAIKKKMTKASMDADSFAMELAKDEMRVLKAPEAPICKRYYTNDATIEKMHELLSQNPRGLLLSRDELVGLLNDWDRPGHETDRSFYLEGWNGYGAKTSDRINRGTIRTQNMCVSILGSIQPSKLNDYFQNTLSGRENDGLLQRFQMLVYPDQPKHWKLIDEKPNIQARDQAFGIISKLAHMDFCANGANEASIPYFQFDAQGQIVFYEWLTALETKLRNSSDDSILIEHLAKYRKLMPSLALIFHLIDVAAGKPQKAISESNAKLAAAWCGYLEYHARRIYESSQDVCYQAARKLAKKIQAGEFENSFDLRQVYRKNWSLLKSKEEAQMACDILLEQGWLKVSEDPTNKRTKIYWTNPKIAKQVTT